MGYRNVFLLNPARLSVKNEQLVIKSEEIRTIPLEDIESIVVDNLKNTLSAFVLMKCCEYGITLHISNKAHLPTGVLLPENSHKRHLQVLKAQLDFSKPQLKQLWQQIIVNKIINQATVLKLCGCERYKDLEQIKLKVKSGDTDNMEAVAAAQYFKLLFGNKFTRSTNNILNAFLNYGYAILRSTIAKNLCVYGFEPSLGIFHHSTLNNFNLADDIIEAYRPIVDLYVATNASEDLAVFSSLDKASLLNLLNADVVINEKKYAVSYGIEKTVKSLSGIINKKGDVLMLPKIVPLNQHQYE